MKYLPYEREVLHSKLKKNELIERLSKSIGKPQGFFNYVHDNGAPFNGTITDNGFQITRVINYRNSFLPEIIGEINETLSGTEVRLKFRLNYFVIVFMSVWMGVVSLACIAMLFYLITGGAFNPFLLIPIGMFIFGALLILLPFKYEVKKAKRILSKILKAEINVFSSH